MVIMLKKDKNNPNQYAEVTTIKKDNVYCSFLYGLRESEMNVTKGISSLYRKWFKGK